MANEIRDAEALAHDIAVAIYKDDSIDPRDCNAVTKKILPFLTRPADAPLGVTVDVEKATADIVAYVLPKSSRDIINFDQVAQYITRYLKPAPKLEGDVEEIRGLPSLLRQQAHYDLGPSFGPASETMEKAAVTIETLSADFDRAQRKGFELSAKLAEAENNLIIFDNDNTKLIAKLARAEARVENLEATLDGRSDEQALREDTP